MNAGCGDETNQRVLWKKGGTGRDKKERKTEITVYWV